MEVEKVERKKQMNWTWINRELPCDFWETAGKLPMSEWDARFEEIPEDLRLTAYTIITAALNSAKWKEDRKEKVSYECCRFRALLFHVHTEMENEGIKIPMPYYWWLDGVMIEPEWIVRITNGIIGWVCDESMENCGMMDRCRFYGVIKDGNNK